MYVNTQLRNNLIAINKLLTVIEKDFVKNKQIQ